MVRLYEYADSNDKTGLFLRGKSKQGNTTFQVTSLGEKLLRTLDYQPGIVNHRQGPRIPDKLHWGLYEIEWVTTGNGDISPPTDKEGELIIENEDVVFTEEMAQDIQSFLEGLDGDTDDTKTLADLLGFEPSSTTEIPIWEATDAELKSVNEYFDENLDLDSFMQQEAWNAVTKTIKQKVEGREKVAIQVHVTNKYDEDEKYFHIAYLCPKHGFEQFSTVVRDDVTWEMRSTVEEHRGEIMQTLFSMRDELNFELGSPNADLTLLTHPNIDFSESEKC